MKSNPAKGSRGPSRFGTDLNRVQMKQCRIAVQTRGDWTFKLRYFLTHLHIYTWGAGAAASFISTSDTDDVDEESGADSDGSVGESVFDFLAGGFSTASSLVLAAWAVEKEKRFNSTREEWWNSFIWVFLFNPLAKRKLNLTTKEIFCNLIFWCTPYMNLLANKFKTKKWNPRGPRNLKALPRFLKYWSVISIFQKLVYVIKSLRYGEF